MGIGLTTDLSLQDLRTEPNWVGVSTLVNVVTLACCGLDTASEHDATRNGR